MTGREDHWTRDEKGARDAEYFRALDEDDDRPTAAEIARDEEGDR